MKSKLQNTREEYQHSSLDKDQVKSDPLDQFKIWYRQYEEISQKDPNAFVLATADKQGGVSARVVLLKGIEKGSFEFYTNYESRKGRQMAENPAVSMTFFWPELERQVRVEGTVEKVSAEESTAYFQSRPRGSQLGAWVSPQSETIPSREVLETRGREIAKRFTNKVPRPDHWGGYRIIPQRIEFWQGRPSRLHDRICYEKKDAGGWDVLRLAP